MATLQLQPSFFPYGEVENSNDPITNAVIYKRNYKERLANNKSHRPISHLVEIIMDDWQGLWWFLLRVGGVVQALRWVL